MLVKWNHMEAYLLLEPVLLRFKLWLTCEQALRGALASRWEKEGQHATTSLKFENLHRKSRCEMLIGGDDINNGVITLGARVF